MSKEKHPFVQRYRERSSAPALSPLEAAELRRICLESSADDVGFLSIDDPEIAVHKPDIIKLFRGTRTVVSLLCRMNQEPWAAIAAIAIVWLARRPKPAQRVIAAAD